MEWTVPEEAQFLAANEYYGLILGRLADERGVHAETAISAAARMAGTFMLRSFGLPLEGMEPGSAVLSEAANDRGPLLLNTLGAGLNALDVVLDPDRIRSDFPDDNRPHLSVTEVQERLEASMREVAVKHHLGDEQAAHAAALATARLIKATSQVLDPHVAFALAAYGFVEGSKTVPVSLG